MSPSEQLRTFIGVPLVGLAREKIVALQGSLRSELGGDTLIKWERTPNLHVTLKFLGDTDPELLSVITEALEHSASERDPFALTLGPPTAFGGRAPRVLVVSIGAGADALAAIQRDLEGELEALGFPREARPFNPHVTIGRVRRGRKLSRADVEQAALAQGQTTAGATMKVEEIVHFRSELSPAGATYSRLSTVGLGGAHRPGLSPRAVQ